MSVQAPILEVKGLVKQFDDKIVLNGIDIQVEKDKVIAILGHHRRSMG